MSKKEYDPEPRKKGKVPPQLRAWVFRKRDPSPGRVPLAVGKRGGRAFISKSGRWRYDPEWGTLAAGARRIYAARGSILGKAARAIVAAASGYLHELGGKAVYGLTNNFKVVPIPNYDYLNHMKNPANYVSLAGGVVESAVGSEGGILEATGHGGLGHFGGRLADASWGFTTQYQHGGPAAENYAYQQGRSPQLIALPLKY